MILQIPRHLEFTIELGLACHYQSSYRKAINLSYPALRDHYERQTEEAYQLARWLDVPVDVIADWADCAVAA